LAKNYQEKN